MHEVVTTQRLSVKGVDVEVSGLLHMECPECGATLETPDQMDVNGELVRAKYMEERERFKRERGLLTGQEILAFRKRFGLTQKEAGALLGGGPVAFAKYEAEDVVQATAMDNLIRVCMENPANMLILARGKAIELSDETTARIDGHFTDMLSTMAPTIQKMLDAEMARKQPRIEPVRAVVHKPKAQVFRLEDWKEAA